MLFHAAPHGDSVVMALRNDTINFGKEILRKTFPPFPHKGKEY